MMLSGYEWGERNEERLLMLANRIAWMTPYWYLGLVRADPELDARGIDALALVIRNDDESRGWIPVQLKSSEEEAEDFKYSHPELMYAGMAIVVSERRINDDMVLWRFFDALRQVRKEGRRAEPLLRRLAGEPMDRRLSRIVERISVRRYSREQMLI